MHPYAVKHIITPLQEGLVGRPTLSYLRDLEKSQWLPAEALRDLQTQKLRLLARHAYRHCPFYRDRFDDAGVDPDKIDLNSLADLPTLAKADIVEAGKTIVDASKRGELRPASTGGSSGPPLRFFVDRTREAADQAARARSRRWFGVDLGEREVCLWGSLDPQPDPDGWGRLKDWFTNQVLLNAFRMSTNDMRAYLREIARFDPVYLSGYSSSIAKMLRFSSETGFAFEAPSLRAVFVNGEALKPTDRAIIEEAVSVPVADGYAASEAGFIAHQCPDMSYHVTMESMIVELLDAEGKAAAEDEPGEITVTHLDAFGMPFIRYRTGDMARCETGICTCGRQLERLIEIQGRSTDMIRTPDGAQSHAMSLIHVLHEEPEIAQFRIFQRRDWSLDITLCLCNPLSDERLDAIRARLASQMSGSMDVRIHVVDEIPPEPSGQHRCIVSEAE
jgi:phenylacetate-CoA ligase